MKTKDKGDVKATEQRRLVVFWIGRRPGVKLELMGLSFTPIGAPDRSGLRGNKECHRDVRPRKIISTLASVTVSVRTSTHLVPTSP